MSRELSGGTKEFVKGGIYECIERSFDVAFKCVRHLHVPGRLHSLASSLGNLRIAARTGCVRRCASSAAGSGVQARRKALQSSAHPRGAGPVSSTTTWAGVLPFIIFHYCHPRTLN